MKISTAWHYILNYASAFALIAAAAWFVAKPHAQTLINDTVAGQFRQVKTEIEEIQKDVNNLATTQRALVQSLGDLEGAIDRQSAEQLPLLEDIKRALEANQ